MRSHNTSTLKTYGFGLSGVSIFYIGMIHIAFLLAWLLLLIPLKHFFPLIINNDWIVFLPYLLLVALLVLHLLSSFYTVTLTENAVVLSWLCIPLRRLSVDTLQLFCAVGNEREDVLCLTSRTIEEMALLEEKHLLRNYFTKYDVPFLKKKADWQDALAKKYLNRMRRSPLGIFRDKMTLFMTMNPVVQHQIHNLYTQLPYKNYTGITGYKVNAFLDKTKAPCLWMQLEPCSVEIQEDAVVLYTKKETKRRILLRDIKTIVRVDIFRAYDKYYPHHLPILFLSVRSLEEISEKQPLQKLINICKCIDMPQKKRCVGLLKGTTAAICPTHLKSCRVFICCAVMHNGWIYQMAGYLTHLDWLYLTDFVTSPRF